MTLKIHVEVFIAAQLLAQRSETFTPGRLQYEVARRFGDTRVGVRSYISEHCIANMPKSASKCYNYLWKTEEGTLRTFNRHTDQPHSSRVDNKLKPDTQDVPTEYRYLLSTGKNKTPMMIVREVSKEGSPLFLYLLKSAVNNERLQENLQLLAAPTGKSYDVHYTTRSISFESKGDTARWVTPAPWKYIERGETVCIVFCDPPYWNFIPVRQGKILNVLERGNELILTLMLGTFVQNVDLERFSAQFRELTERRSFIMRDPANALTFLPEERDDRAAWRDIINALHTSTGEQWENPYRQTVFVRSLALTGLNGQALKNNTLETGQTYIQSLDFYVPNLTTQSGEEYELVLSPEGSNIRVSSSLPLTTNGIRNVKIEPIKPGPTVLKTWVKPNRAQSTALSLNYQIIQPGHVNIKARQKTITPPLHLSDRQLRAIFEVLRTPEGPVRKQAALSLIDHVLSPLTPHSHYLQEQRGIVLYELQQWQEAYAQFTRLDPDRFSPYALVAWFVSACHSGMDIDLSAILSRFNAWEQRPLVNQLISALPLVEETRRLQIIQDAWLGAGCYHEMWDAVKDTFTQPKSILRAAELMVDPTLYHLLTPAQGYTYLRDHTETWADVPLDFLQKAVEWGLQEPDQALNLDDAFLCLIERLLQRGSDPMELWSLVDSARGLSPYTWAVATEQLAEAFSRKPEEAWRTQACLFYIELARVYRERLQDLDKAEGCLNQANLLVGDDTELAEQVNTEEANWEAAIERIEAVRIWRDGLQEIRLKRLRELLQGKRAVFVGGADRGFDIEPIRKELGLAEAEFIPYYRSERGNLSKVRQKIQQGKVDYVVDFARFGAHRNLEGYCYNAGVTYVRVMHSRNTDQIVRAFALAHNIKMES